MHHPHARLKRGALRRHREAAGLTIRQLAEQTGVDRSHYGEAELGNRGLELTSVMRLARRYKVAVEELVELVDDNDEPVLPDRAPEADVCPAVPA